VKLLIPFDDRRNYYLALRTYDDEGDESANSNSGVVRATALAEGCTRTTSNRIGPGRIRLLARHRQRLDRDGRRGAA
jgi:hypothetical protein